MYKTFLTKVLEVSISVFLRKFVVVHHEQILITQLLWPEYLLNLLENSGFFLFKGYAYSTELFLPKCDVFTVSF